MVHPNFKLSDPSLLLVTGWINDAPAKTVSGRAPFEVTDPANGEVWTTMESMDDADTDVAIAAATAAFPFFSAIPARQRARMILELDRLVRENKEDLAILNTMESGKALVESRAEVDYAGELLERRDRESRSEQANRRCEQARETGWWAADSQVGTALLVGLSPARRSGPVGLHRGDPA
jgi:acyl-CoA reductase-like NAD-dependent aldehyde dehydrogenase